MRRYYCWNQHTGVVESAVYLSQELFQGLVDSKALKMEEEREHAQLNEKKWDLAAETYDKLINRLWFRFTQKRVLSLLDLHENQCFLDMGCGTGWAVDYAASLIKNKGKFYGIDISSKMIEIAEKNYSGRENTYFYKADATALPCVPVCLALCDHCLCGELFHQGNSAT